MEFYDFPETVVNVKIPTDFHCHIFQRGRWLNHQPVHMNIHIYIYCIILYNNRMFTRILYSCLL